MASNSAELLARLRLTLVPGIGPKLHRALVEDFGSAENVWQAPPSQWTRVPGIGTKHRGALIEAREGDTTGISAADRARTIQVAIDPDAGPR